MASDRDALLQAILAYPDEDTPRKAFADILMGEDDPVDRARGRFIEVQLMKDRLEREEHELLRHYADTWLRQDLGEDYRNYLLEMDEGIHSNLKYSPYRRGFVERVLFGKEEDFHNNFERLSKMHPIREVNLYIEPTTTTRQGLLTLPSIQHLLDQVRDKKLTAINTNDDSPLYDLLIEKGMQQNAPVHYIGEYNMYHNEHGVEVIVPGHILNEPNLIQEGYANFPMQFIPTEPPQRAR